MRNLIVLVKTQTAFDLSLHLVREDDLVYEFRLDVVLGIGEGHDAVVGHLVQVFGFHAATLSHLFQPIVPDAVEVDGALFTVVVAHASLGVALHITLVLAHLGHKILDAELVI